MGDPVPSRPRRAFTGALASFALVAGASFCIDRTGALERLHAWWWHGRGWEAGSILQQVLDRFGHATTEVVPMACATALVATAVLFPLGFLVRTVARARVRAGHRDPLDRVRAWMTAHPRLARRLPWLMASPWVWNTAQGSSRWLYPASPVERLWVTSVWALLAGVAAIALLALFRRGVAVLIAPTLDETKAPSAAVQKGDITFAAVAVTRETRFAVGTMAATSLVCAGWLATLSTHALYHDAYVGLAVAAYVLITLGGAALFRRASRVAVGVDGVLVTGTSRTRFFAFRDLDAARVSRGDLELVRRERVVLRLQLHGEDAARRASVLGRIRDAIDRVKLGDDAAAQSIAQSATIAALTRASAGAQDFRAPAVSREALWSLVEGPTTDAETRAAAAEALVGTRVDPSERPRLRVAAAHCAEPRARLALEKLIAGDALEDVGHVSTTLSLARRSA